MTIVRRAVVRRTVVQTFLCGKMCVTHSCTNRCAWWNKLFCMWRNMQCERDCQFGTEQSIHVLDVKKKCTQANLAAFKNGQV